MIFGPEYMDPVVNILLGVHYGGGIELLNAIDRNAGLEIAYMT